MLASQEWLKEKNRGDLQGLVPSVRTLMLERMCGCCQWEERTGTGLLIFERPCIPTFSPSGGKGLCRISR